MKGVHISTAALCVAAGQLLVAIGNKNAGAFYAAITAVMACFLPSVLSWLSQPAENPEITVAPPPPPKPTQE